MSRWIELERFGAERKVPVNVEQIAYVDRSQGGAMIYFGSGASLRVADSVEEVMALVGVGAPSSDAGELPHVEAAALGPTEVEPQPPQPAGDLPASAIMADRRPQRSRRS